MNISPTREALNVMASLRPPSSRPLRLVYDFSQEVYTNDGYTFELAEGEQPTSPGSGTIVGIIKVFAKFKHTAGQLTNNSSYQITIVHGGGVTSVVAGLASVAVREGDYIRRGDILGALVTREVFLGVRYNGRAFNPHELSRHWKLQGEYVPGQAGFLRFSPDKLIRNFAGTIASVLWGGVRYFVDQVLGFKPLLVNVDFNGNGTMKGLAALGFTSEDYWNVFAAGAFNWQNNVYSCYAYTYGSYTYGGGWCGPTKTFNVSPQTFLKDSTGADSSVWLERIAAATAAAGTSTGFDAVSSTYIGGWSGGIIPEENFFAIRGLGAGTYRLALLCWSFNRTPNFGANFGVAVDNNPPSFLNTAPFATPAWIDGTTYVHFDLVVPAGSVITIKAYGYFDGLQVERLS